MRIKKHSSASFTEERKKNLDLAISGPTNFRENTQAKKIGLFLVLVLVLALFCFVLFCFVLFCFVLFCFVLFCFVLFCFVSPHPCHSQRTK